MASSYTSALRKKLREERSIRLQAIKSRVLTNRIAAKMFKGKSVSSYASKFGITNYPKSIGKLKGLHGAIQADPRMGPYIRNKKSRPMTEKQKAALRKAQLASAKARRQRSTGRK
jgi:hypothetical protein